MTDSTPKINILLCKLKPKWRERFEFFERYGEPSSPEAKAAFKQLPRAKQRLINFCWLGFFFGGTYWLVLGMWRRAILWLAIVSASGLLEALFTTVTNIKIPEAIDFGITVGINLLSAQATNYSYYLKVVKGDNGWNPFKGLR